jgi:hypothetical protein
LKITRKKANWLCNILLRNCPPKHVTEGKIEGGREIKVWPGRRCKQLLDDLKKRYDSRN